MLAPVVVKPDVVSKNAFTKFGIMPLIIKGNEPKSDTSIQPTPQITRPSRAYILTDDGLKHFKIIPSKNNKAIGMINEIYSASLKPCIL